LQREAKISVMAVIALLIVDRIRDREMQQPLRSNQRPAQGDNPCWRLIQAGVLYLSTPISLALQTPTMRNPVILNSSRFFFTGTFFFFPSLPLSLSFPWEITYSFDMPHPHSLIIEASYRNRFTCRLHEFFWII
jgi:hypothetical protein